MKTYMPMLLLRTAHAQVAVELNGSLLGEASPDEHIALPLSSAGEYYIAVYPLLSGPERLYPVVRKVAFRDGAPLPVESGDVELYAWPNGVYEAVLSPGVLPAPAETVFPYTVAQAALPDGCVATLFYEAGLKLAVEQGARLLYGTTLEGGRTGSLNVLNNGMLCAIAGEPALPGGNVPPEYGRLLLLLDEGYGEALRVKGDAVGLAKEAVHCFTRLPTLLRHERKEVYRYADGAFAREPPQIGFFTHTPSAPHPGQELVRAFCEAAQLGLWEEAFSYLTPALRDGLTQETIRECLGEFLACRTPLSRRDAAMGLCYAPRDGVTPVRVFSFEISDGLIDNITED